MMLFHSKWHGIGLGGFVALMLADLVNSFLKWPMAGDRPYWTDPQVRQFKVTCESGFGHPSGHCMGSAAFWLTVAHASPSWLLPPTALFLVLVAVSRVHIGAHFPSQVVAGIVCGAVMAWVGRKMAPSVQGVLRCGVGSRVVFAGLVSVVILGFAAAEVWVLSAYFDVHRSIAFAKAACQLGPEGVHVSTGPIVTITKWAAISFGVVVAIGVAHVTRANPRRAPLWRRGIVFGLGVFVLSIVSDLESHYEHMKAGYVVALVLYGLIRTSLPSDTRDIHRFLPAVFPYTRLFFATLL